MEILRMQGDIYNHSGLV